MSETGGTTDRQHCCPSCGGPMSGRATVCMPCHRDRQALAREARATVKAARKPRGVRPLTDTELARGLGQEDQRATYRANGWLSGLRESPQDKPKAALGAGRITATTAVPSARLINARADRGAGNRAPSEVVHAIGKLAHDIRHAGTAVPRKCAELRTMLGAIAASGCVSNAQLRRNVAQATEALALAALR